MPEFLLDLHHFDAHFHHIHFPQASPHPAINERQIAHDRSES
jgi:hypothetical protein